MYRTLRTPTPPALTASEANVHVLSSKCAVVMEQNWFFYNSLKHTPLKICLLEGDFKRFAFVRTFRYITSS